MREEWTYPAETVIPGHGEISDNSAIMTIIEYFEGFKDAVGDKEKIEKLRNKYKHLGGVPFMSGFDKTLGYFSKKANKSKEN